MMNVITDIESWYSNQCDGDWEHIFGIKIENIDNPGWKISIPLERTSCEEKFFHELKVNRSETNWLHCLKQDNKFIGYGGIRNLNEIISIFLEWQKSDDCV